MEAAQNQRTDRSKYPSVLDEFRVMFLNYKPSFLVSMLHYQFMLYFLNGENVRASGICRVSEMNDFIVKSCHRGSLGPSV